MRSIQGFVLLLGVVGCSGNVSAPHSASNGDATGTGSDTAPDSVPPPAGMDPSDPPGPNPDPDPDSDSDRDPDARPDDPGTLAAGPWLPLISRQHEQFDAGIAGGIGYQFMRSWATSPARPERVIAAHDIGTPIMTESFGDAWFTPTNDGLHGGVSGQGAAIDSEDPDRVLLIYSASSRRVFPEWDAWAGIYLSTDGGESFEFVQHLPNVSGSAENKGSRFNQHPLAEAPGKTPETRTWYTFYSPQPRDGDRQDGALYRSLDGGRTWKTRGPKLPVARFGDKLSVLRCASNGSLFLGTNRGVFRSEDDGLSWDKLNDLPSGWTENIDVRGSNGEIWASVNGRGLFRSTDHGTNWRRNAGLGQYDIRTFAISPADRDRITVAGETGVSPRYTHDGGASWSTIDTKTYAGQPDTFSHKIHGGTAWFLWHESDPDFVIAMRYQHIGRSTDGGKTFVWASNNFDWNTTHGIGFHPTDWTKSLAAMQDRVFAYTETAYDWVWDDRIDRPEKDRLDEVLGYDSPAHKAQSALILVNGSVTGVIGAAGGQKGVVPVVLKRRGDNPIGDTEIRSFPQGAWAIHAANDPEDHSRGWIGRWRAKLYPGGDVSFSDVRWEFMGIDSDGAIYGVEMNKGEQIRRSTDGGESWTVWTTAPERFRPINSKPSMFVSPHRTFRVYAATSSGKVHLIDGREGRSTVVFDLRKLLPGGLPGYEVQSVVVDPFDEDLIYVSVNTYGAAVVFRSRDGGSSWHDVTGNAPRIPGRLMIHPHTSDVILSWQHGSHILAPPDEHRDRYGITESLYDRVRGYLDGR